jgi:hypothetical protein
VAQGTREELGTRRFEQDGRALPAVFAGMAQREPAQQVCIAVLGPQNLVVWDAEQVGIGVVAVQVARQ